jgi:copper resistance protein B
MTRLLLAAAAAALALPAAAQDIPPHDKAQAHPQRLFHMVRVEADYARPDDQGVVSWEGDAWFGGDRHKLWLKSEGESGDGELEDARVEALYSRNVATFWDLQVGVRHDFEPAATSYLAAGVQGLAPYQFETEAFAYLADDGVLSARLSQSLDVHLTQRLILEPEAELELHADDAPDRGVGAGFSSAEVSAQLRYEVSRKFAPYVELAWEKRLGETADLARADGEDVEITFLRAGLRVWF